ncbi:MAG: carbohydrate-binding domain-containing protein [Lachnospiraceae bacterium]|nr:carbohydrate-binding domain-containing protein [Lachnospiraceae bacterium]
MITSGKIDKICVIVISIAVILTILFMNGTRFGIIPVVDMDSESYSGPEYITANDMDGNWDVSGASRIILNGEDARVEGGGAYVNGTDVVIKNGGYYVVTGSFDNGRIIVDAYASSKVWLMLENVSLHCEDDACIRIEEADKVFVTLAENSTNTVSGGDGYSDREVSDSIGAAVFSHDDLTINGSGTLIVNAGYRHGIKANDDLAIAGCNVFVTSLQDAVHVNEDVAIVNAMLTINAGDDAVTTEGTIYVDNSDILVNKCNEGLEARHINVYSGNIEIYPKDDGFNASSGKNTVPFYGQIDDEVSDEEDDVKELPSINVYDGNIKIINDTALDSDGLDSNGNIYIYGGNIFISLRNSGPSNAIDYGSKSGGVCVIEGGTVIACGSYTMAEGFDSSSSQPSIMYTISEGVEAGSVISVETEDEAVILSAEIPCSFSCAIISCAQLKVGDTYLINIGNKVDDITLDEVSASYGDVQSMGFGGSMNFSGMKRRDKFRQGATRLPDSKSASDDLESEEKRLGNTESMEHPVLPEGPEPPGMTGEIKNPEMNGISESIEGDVGTTDSITRSKTFSEYDSRTWIEIAVSLLSFALVMIFVVKYHRR